MNGTNVKRNPSPGGLLGRGTSSRLDRRATRRQLLILLTCLASVGCPERGGEPEARTSRGASPAIAAAGPQSLAPPAGPGPSSLERGASDAARRAAMEGYGLDYPTQVNELPPMLDEASGLTDVSSTEVALVQDEKGVIFVYDLLSGAVTQKIRFGPPGDYEGLTRVGDTMLVLRSDGTLYEVRNWRAAANVRVRSLGLPTSDNEGLGYHPGLKRVLIAPKSRWQRGKAGKHVRPVFSFDLGSGRVDPEPHVVLDLRDLVRFGEERDRELPVKATKSGSEKLALRFMPASLAIHPSTRELFVLSAQDRVLASFEQPGNVTGYHRLAAPLFPQAEGLTFLPDATLVIVSEAAGQRAKLVQFRWSGAAP